MASGIQLNSTNNSEMNIVYQGTSGATRTVVVPDKSFTVAGTDEVIGVGQTWQNVTAGRALGVVYTNNTGKPISVSISGTGVGTASASQVRWGINSIIGGYLQASTANGGSWSPITWLMTFIVPNGSTYQIDNHAGANSLFLWMELR